MKVKHPQGIPPTAEPPVRKREDKSARADAAASGLFSDLNTNIRDQFTHLAKDVAQRITRPILTRIGVGVQLGLVGAAVLGKKIEEFAEPLVGQARHFYLAGRVQQLKVDAAKLPPVFARELTVLEPDLAHYDASLNLDALAKDIDRAEFLIAEYRELATLPDIDTLSNDAPERYQAAWTNAIENADHRAQQIIFRNHRLIAQRADLNDALTESRLTPAQRQFVARTDYMLGDLNTPLADKPELNTAIASLSATTGAVRLHTLTFDGRLHGHKAADLFASSMRKYAEELLTHSEQLWTGAATEHARDTAAIQQALAAAATTAAAPLSLATKDRLLEALSWMGDHDTRRELLDASRDPSATHLSALPRKTSVALQYASDILQRYSADNARWQSLVPWAGVKDPRRLEYTHAGWGDVGVDVMNDNVITRAYREMVHSDNPAEQRQAELAKAATHKFIERLNDVARAPQDIRLTTDEDWAALEKTILHDSATLDGLDAVLARAEGISERNKPADPTQKRIEFLAAANRLLGAEGRNPGHTSDAQAARGHYPIAENMLAYMQRHYPFGVSHATAQQRLAMVMNEDADIDARRHAATVYEYYLYQEEQKSRTRLWGELQGSPDLGIRAAAEGAIRDAQNEKRYDASAYETIPRIVQRNSQFNHKYQPLAALKSLRDYEDQIAASKELIQEYTLTGKKKTAEEQFIYQLNAGMAVRIARLIQDFDPLDLDKKLTEIREARKDIQAGNMNRFSAVTHVIEGSQTLAHVQGLTEEALKVNVARDLVREGITFAAATIATAGVGTALELAAQSARLGVATEGLVAGAQTVSRFKRAQQMAATIAKASGHAVAKQGTFLHTKAAAELAIAGHQSLYDPNASIQDNLFNLGVSIVEFELMGKFHKVFKDVWQVAPAVERASILRQLISGTRAKAHELVRDVVFFHGWLPAAGIIKTVAHVDTEHLIKSVDDFGSQEGLAHTAMMTLSMGTGLGTPLAQKLSRAVLKSRVPEIRRVASQQKQIEKLEHKLAGVKGRSLKDLDRIAEVRYQQLEIARRNAHLMDAAVARHPESEALREQAKQMHLIVNQYFHANRHVERLWSLTQMHQEQNQLTHDYKAPKDLHAKKIILGDLRDNAERRTALARTMFADGMLDAHTLTEIEKQNHRVALEEHILANTEGIDIAVSALESLPQDATIDQITDHVATLLARYSVQKELIRRSRMLIPNRFPPEAMRKVSSAIAILTHSLEAKSGIREVTQHYRKLIAETQRGADYADTISVSLDQEASLLSKASKRKPAAGAVFLTEAEGLMRKRHHAMAQYATHFGIPPEVLADLQRQAQLEEKMLQAAKTDHSIIPQASLLLHMTHARFHAMRIFLNNPDPALHDRLGVALERSESELRDFIGHAAHSHPKLHALVPLLPEHRTPLSTALRPRGIMWRTVMLMPLAVGLGTVGAAAGMRITAPIRRTPPSEGALFETGIPGLGGLPLIAHDASTEQRIIVGETQFNTVDGWLRTHYLPKTEAEQYALSTEIGVTYRTWVNHVENRVRDALAQYESGKMTADDMKALQRSVENEEGCFQLVFDAIDRNVEMPRSDPRKWFSGNLKSAVTQSLQTWLGVLGMVSGDIRAKALPKHAEYRDFIALHTLRGTESGYPEGMMVHESVHEIARELMWWLNDRGTLHARGTELTWEAPSTVKPTEGARKTQFDHTPWPPDLANNHYLSSMLKFLGWSMDVVQHGDRVSVTLHTAPKANIPHEETGLFGTPMDIGIQGLSKIPMPNRVEAVIPEKVLHDQKAAVANWLNIHVADQEQPVRLSAIADVTREHEAWIHRADKQLRIILSDLADNRIDLETATTQCRRIVSEGNIFILIHDALNNALRPIEKGFATLQRSSLSQMHNAISGAAELIPLGIGTTKGDPTLYDILDIIHTPQGNDYGLAIPRPLYESARNLLWWLDNYGERLEGQLTWVRHDQVSEKRLHKTLFDSYLRAPSPATDAILAAHLKILGWEMQVDNGGQRVTLVVPPEQILRSESPPPLNLATVNALPEVLRNAIRHHRFENTTDEAKLSQAILHDPTTAGDGILGQLIKSMIWGALLDVPQSATNPGMSAMVSKGATVLHDLLSALEKLPPEIRPEGQKKTRDATADYLLALHHDTHANRLLRNVLKVVDHDYHTDFLAQLDRALGDVEGFGLFGGPLMPVLLIEKFGRLMDRAIQAGRDLLAARAATFQARAEKAAESAQAVPEGETLPLALRREKAQLEAEAARIEAELRHEELFVPDSATSIPPIIATAIQAYQPHWDIGSAEAGVTRAALLTTLEHIIAKADLIPFVNDQRRPHITEDLKSFPQELDDMMRGINALPKTFHLPKESEEPIVAGYFREVCKDPFHRRQLIGALRLLDEHNTYVRRQPTQYSAIFSRLIQDASTEIPVIPGQAQDPVAKGKLESDRSIAAHFVGKDDATQAHIGLATITSQLNWLKGFEAYLSEVIVAAQTTPLTGEQRRDFATAHLQLIQGMTVIAHTQRELARASGTDAAQQLLHAMVGSIGQRFNIVRGVYDLVRDRLESPEKIAEAAELLDALKSDVDATPLEKQQFERTFKEYLEGNERPKSGYFKDFPWPADPSHPLVAAGYQFLGLEIPRPESASTLAATRDVRRPAAAAADTPEGLKATRDVRRPQPEGSSTPRSGKTYVPMGAWRNNSDIAAIISPEHVHVVEGGKFRSDFDMENRANSYLISDGIAHFAGYIKLNQSAEGAAAALLRALEALARHPNIPRPHRRRSDMGSETAMESHLREAYQTHGDVIEFALRYIQTHVTEVARFGEMAPEQVERAAQNYLKILKLDPNPPAPQVITEPQPPPRPIAAAPEIIAHAQTENRQFLRDIESVTGGAGTKSKTLLFRTRLDIRSPGDSATTAHRVLVDAATGKILKEHSGQGEQLRQAGQNVERITLRLFNIAGSEELRPIRHRLVEEGAHRRSEIPQWLMNAIQQARAGSDLAYAYEQASRDAKREGHAVRLHDLFVSRVRQIEPDRSGYIPRAVAEALRDLSGTAFGKSTLPGPDNGGDPGGGSNRGPGGTPEGGKRGLRETIRESLPGLPEALTDRPTLPLDQVGPDGKVTKHSGAPWVEDLAKQAIRRVQDFFAGGKDLPALPISATTDFDAREAARNTRRPILEEWVRRNLFTNPNGTGTKETLKKFLAAADLMAQDFKQRLLANPNDARAIQSEWRRHSAVFQEVLEVLMIMTHSAPILRSTEQTHAARSAMINRIKSHLAGSLSATGILIESTIDLPSTIAHTYDRIEDAPVLTDDAISRMTPSDAAVLAYKYQSLFGSPKEDGLIGIRALDHFGALVRAGKLTEAQLREGAYDLAQSLILGYAGNHSPIAPHSLLFYAHRMLGLTERQATRTAHDQAKIWEDEAFAGLMKQVPGNEQPTHQHEPIAATDVTTAHFANILAKHFHEGKKLDADLQQTQDDIVHYLFTEEEKIDNIFAKDTTSHFIVRTRLRTDIYLRLLDIRIQSELRAHGDNNVQAALNPIVAEILNAAFAGPRIPTLKGHIDITDRDGILVLRPENIDDFAAIRAVTANKLEERQNLPFGFFNPISTLGIPVIVISPDCSDEAWGILRHELQHFHKFASNRNERGAVPPLPNNLVQNGKINPAAQTRFMNGMRDYLFKLAKDETLAHLANARPPQGVVTDLTKPGGLYDYIDLVKTELAERIESQVGDTMVSGKHSGPITVRDYAMSRIDTMRARHDQGITQNVWQLYDAVETLVDHGYHPEAARQTLIQALTPVPYTNWSKQLPKIIAQLKTRPASKLPPESLNPQDHHFQLRRWIENSNPTVKEVHEHLQHSNDSQQLREVLHIMLGELESRREVMRRHGNNISEVVRLTEKIDHIKTLIAAARVQAPAPQETPASELSPIIGADNAATLEAQLRPDVLGAAVQWFRAYRDAGLSMDLDPGMVMARLAQRGHTMYPEGLKGIAAYKDLINALPRELRTRLIERNALRTSHFNELEKAGVLARPTVVAELATLASYLGNVIADADVIKSYGYTTKAAAEFGITLTAEETRFLSKNNANLKTDIATGATLGAITPRDAFVAQIQRYHILKEQFQITDDHLPTGTIATTPINDRYSIQVEIGHRPTDVESACGFNIKLHANNSFDIATISVQVTDTSIDIVRYQGSSATTTEAAAFKAFSGGVDPLPWFAQVVGKDLLAQAKASGKTLRFISGNHVRYGYPHEHGRGPEFVHTIADARTFWTHPPQAMIDMAARHDALSAERAIVQQQYDKDPSMPLYGRLASIDHELGGMSGTVRMFRAGPHTQEMYDATAQNLGFRRKGNATAWHRYTKDPAEFGSAIRSRATDTAQLDQSLKIAAQSLAQFPKLAGQKSQLPGLPEPLAEQPPSPPRQMGHDGKVTNYSGAPFVEELLKDAARWLHRTIFTDELAASPREGTAPYTRSWRAMNDALNSMTARVETLAAEAEKSTSKEELAAIRQELGQLISAHEALQSQMAASEPKARYQKFLDFVQRRSPAFNSAVTRLGQRIETRLAVGQLSDAPPTDRIPRPVLNNFVTWYKSVMGEASKINAEDVAEYPYPEIRRALSKLPPKSATPAQVINLLDSNFTSKPNVLPNIIAAWQLLQRDGRVPSAKETRDFATNILHGYALEDVTLGITPDGDTIRMTLPVAHYNGQKELSAAEEAREPMLRAWVKQNLMGASPQKRIESLHAVMRSIDRLCSTTLQELNATSDVPTLVRLRDRWHALSAVFQDITDLTIDIGDRTVFDSLKQRMSAAHFSNIQHLINHKIETTSHYSINAIGSAALLFGQQTLGGVDSVRSMTDVIANNPGMLALGGAVFLAVGSYALWRLLRPHPKNGVAEVPPQIIEEGGRHLLVILPGRTDTQIMKIDGMPEVEFRWHRGHMEIRDMRIPEPASRLSLRRPRAASRIATNDIPLLINGQPPRAQAWYQLKYGDTVQLGHRVCEVSKSPGRVKHLTPPKGTPPAQEAPQVQQPNAVDLQATARHLMETSHIPDDVATNPRSLKIWKKTLQQMSDIGIAKVLGENRLFSEVTVPVDGDGFVTIDDAIDAGMSYKNTQDYQIVRRAVLHWGKAIYEQGGVVVLPSKLNFLTQDLGPLIHYTTYQEFEARVNQEIGEKIPASPKLPPEAAPEPAPTPTPQRAELPIWHTVSNDTKVHLQPYVDAILETNPKRRRDTERDLTLAATELNEFEEGRPPTVHDMKQWIVAARKRHKSSGYHTYHNPHERDPNKAATVIMDLESANQIWIKDFTDGVRQLIPEGLIPGFPEAATPERYFIPGGDHWWFGGDILNLEGDIPIPRYEGRIFFGVDYSQDDHSGVPKAALLYAKLHELALAMKKEGHSIQFKITAKRQGRNDAGVLYFHAKDQERIYKAMLEISRLHVTADRLPLFVAPLTDEQGDALPGIGFAQHPKVSGISFGSLRTQAIAHSRHVLEDEAARGVKRPREEIEGILTAALDAAGIDPDIPAFDKGGRSLFPFLYRRMRFSHEGDAPTEVLRTSDLPGLPPPLEGGPRVGGDGKVQLNMRIPGIDAIASVAQAAFASALRLFSGPPKPYSTQNFTIALTPVGRPSKLSLPFAKSSDVADMEAARVARRPILQKWIKNNLFAHDPEAASTALDQVLIAIAELGNTFNQQLLPPKQASLTSGQYPPVVDEVAHAALYHQWKEQSGIFRELAAIASELAANEDKMMMANLISSEFEIDLWSEIDAKFEVERHKFGIVWQAALDVTDPNFTSAKNYRALASMSHEEAEDFALSLRHDFASNSTIDAMSGVLVFIQLVQLNKLSRTAILAGAQDVANALVNGKATPDSAEHPLYNAKLMLGLSDPLIPLTPDELVTHWTREAAQHLMRMATTPAPQTSSASADGELGFGGGGGVLMIAAMAPQLAKAIQTWWAKGMHELSIRLAMRLNARILSSQDMPHVHTRANSIKNIQFNAQSPAQYRLPLQLDPQTGEIRALLSNRNDAPTNPSDVVVTLQVLIPYYYGPMQGLHSKALAMQVAPDTPLPSSLKKEIQKIVEAPTTPKIFNDWWSMIRGKKKLTLDDVFQHRVVAVDNSRTPEHLQKPLQSLIGKPYVPPELRKAVQPQTHSLSAASGATLLAQIGDGELTSFISQHAAALGLGLLGLSAAMWGASILLRPSKPTSGVQQRRGATPPARTPARSPSPQVPSQVNPDAEYRRIRREINERSTPAPYIDDSGRPHKAIDVLETLVDFRNEPTQANFDKIPKIPGLTENFLAAHPQFQRPEFDPDRRVYADLEDVPPCVILDLSEINAGLKNTPVARPRGVTRTTPPLRSVDPHAPEPTFTLALQEQGLDPQRVREWAVKKESGRIKRNTVIYAGAATLVASAAIAIVATLFSRDDDDEDADASPLVLSERTANGIQKKITDLTTKLKEVSPTAAADEDYGSDIEVRGRAMADARVYSKFITLRERAIRKGERITVNDLETLLNKEGVTDLRARLQFYKLASGYFEHVAATQKRLAKIINIEDTLPTKISDADKIAKFIGEEFGFIPKGKVELMVRDVHIMTVFHDPTDYAAASAPHDPLWRKDPKEYTEEERARLAGILQFAERTGGMSFGRGVTIQKHYGFNENAEILKHEEGHEMDALGPYFARPINPWADPQLAPRLREVSSNPDVELDTADKLLDVLFNNNSQYSFHTEFIQYLREGGRLSQHNPLAKGGLYDPMIRGNYENIIKARYAKHPQLRDEILKRLQAKHDEFYQQADQIYATLKQLDEHFENDPGFEAEHKAKLLSYLAIRGTRDWDLEFLQSFKP